LQNVLQVSQEVRQDLFFGQVATIVSRWFLIAAGVILVLWSADRIDQIPLPIGLMIVLMAMNFYLHGRYLMERPVNANLVYLTSGIDLLIITAMIAVWTPWGAGMANPFFVLLYPTILSFGLVFPPRLTFIYSGLALALYVVVVALTQGSPSLFADLPLEKDLVQRVVTLTGTVGLATFFWRLQRERRRAETARASLWQDVETLTPHPAPVG
jgi:hypothetical protein